jgi:hypothetical protein
LKSGRRRARPLQIRAPVRRAPARGRQGCLRGPTRTCAPSERRQWTTTTSRTDATAKPGEVRRAPRLTSESASRPAPCRNALGDRGPRECEVAQRVLARRSALRVGGRRLVEAASASRAARGRARSGVACGLLRQRLGNDCRRRR